MTFSFKIDLSLIKKNDINKIEKNAIKTFPSIPIIDWKSPLIDDIFKIFTKSKKLGSSVILNDENFLFISCVRISKKFCISFN